ncbi:MAG: GAF domain-containing protein, partial [Terriglobales bacterium]
MADKHNPRNLHRIRTRLATVHGADWELLQACLGLAYTVQQQSAKLAAKSDSLAEGLHPALERIAACAQNLTEATGAAIALGGPDAMVCVARSGQAAPPVGARFDASSGLSGECIRTGEYAICVNAAADPRVNYQACRSLNVASMLYFPFRSAQGRMIGMLGVFASKPLHFSQRDIASLRFTEGLVQEAIGRSTDGPDPATLGVLLKQADFATPHEVVEGAVAPGLPVAAVKAVAVSAPAAKVDTPTAQRQGQPVIPPLPPPKAAIAAATLTASLPPMAQIKIEPKPQPIFVGRVVDESVAEEGELPLEQEPPQARSRIPGILAVLVALLIAFGAWKYSHVFRSAENTAKPSAQPTAQKPVEPAPQPAPPVTSEAPPADRALTSAVSLRS